MPTRCRFALVVILITSCGLGIARAASASSISILPNGSGTTLTITNEDDVLKVDFPNNNLTISVSIVDAGMGPTGQGHADVGFSYSTTLTGATINLPLDLNIFDPGGPLSDTLHEVFQLDTSGLATGSLHWVTDSIDGFAPPALPGGIAMHANGTLQFVNSVTINTELFDVFVESGRDAPSAVPEPASLVLLGTGAAGLVTRIRQRRTS
jgi:hypothetical protein